VAFAERGLDALAQLTDTDRRQRAELLLALAEARDFTGEVPMLKQAAYQAADDARQSGWSEGQARAATLYGRWVVVGQRDPIVQELCEEALRVVGDDPRWRGRLSTTLVNYFVSCGVYSDDVTRLAAESVELARASEDLEGLTAALYQRVATMTSEGRLEDRLALANELVSLSEDRDSARGRLDGLVIRGSIRLEAADVAGFKADVAEMRRLAQRLNWWAADFWASNFEFTLRLLQGDFATLEDDAGAQFNRGTQDVNAFNVYAVQLFSVRRELGQLADIEPLMAATVAQTPDLVAFRAALAATRAELGDVDAAAAELDALARDDFALLPRDQAFVAALTLLAPVAVAAGAVTHATAIEQLLVPHSGCLALGGAAITCFGAVDRYLGMLAACQGKVEAAEQRYEAAAALEERIGAAPALARTRYWWGTLLGRGGRPLLTQARETADRLGMRFLSEQTAAALERAGGGDGRRAGNTESVD
jgi:hypothetical protein